MKWFCRNWYWVGGVVAAVTLIVLAVMWRQLDMLVRLQMLSFVAILIHQLEEYGWPGGEPAIMNIVLQKSDIPNRYPLNQFSAMFTNVWITYTVYLIPVFLPNVIWLGLAPMLFGFGQFIVHGIATNIRLRSWYNPGLGAVVLLHYPIGIYYCWYVVHNGLATTSDWIWGAVYMFLVAGAGVGVMTYKVLANRDSKWVFADEEMERFRVKEKLTKIQ